MLPYTDLWITFGARSLILSVIRLLIIVGLAVWQVHLGYISTEVLVEDALLQKGIIHSSLDVFSHGHFFAYFK